MKTLLCTLILATLGAAAAQAATITITLDQPNQFATPGTTDLDSFSPAMVGLIDPGGQSSLAGARVSLPVGSLGAVAGEALKYAAAGLPPGLAVTAGGTITGIITAAAPAKAATYRVTLSVTNGTGAKATAAFSWQVNPAR